MQVESTASARARIFDYSPARFRKLSVAAVVAFFVVTSTGAVVRLTASGLGCSHWPKCGSAPFPQKGSHAFIEFSNRVLALGAILIMLFAWLVGRRLPGLPDWASKLALGVVAGGIAQIPLGGAVVIFGLQPWLVMAHFLLGLALLGGAVVVAVEAIGLERGRAPAAVPREVGRIGLVLAAACLTLILTGAFATAAGPHPGGSNVHRLGTLLVSVYVHAGATAVFGLAFLFLLGYLAARRERMPLLFRGAVGLLALVLVQVAVGETQYRTHLPWWLVLVHVTLAAAVWAGTVALATLFWRPVGPPAQLRVD